MGLGFVLVGLFIMISIFSVMISIVSGLITFFVSKSKRKRKTLLAVCIPFVFFYSLFFTGFIGSIIVSETKKVDIGIGDYFTVPLNKTYSLSAIDIPDAFYLESDSVCEIRVNNITKIQKNNNCVLGNYNANNDTVQNFFALNLRTNELRFYSTEKELVEKENLKRLDFISANKFYSEQYWENAGIYLVIVVIVSLLVSALISYFTGKIFLFLCKKYYD